MRSRPFQFGSGYPPALGVKATITIADAEHDNLFIAVRPETGDSTLSNVRY